MLVCPAVPQHPPSSSSSGNPKQLHLMFSMVVAEASRSEAGRTTLRAWQQTHVGDAHGVATEVERLGLLAFCDPSEVRAELLCTAVDEI